MPSSGTKQLPCPDACSPAGPPGCAAAELPSCRCACPHSCLLPSTRHEGSGRARQSLSGDQAPVQRSAINIPGILHAGDVLSCKTEQLLRLAPRHPVPLGDVEVLEALGLGFG
eukprot:424080-Rhodomonas_salina.1